MIATDETPKADLITLFLPDATRNLLHRRSTQSKIQNPKSKIVLLMPLRPPDNAITQRNQHRQSHTLIC